MHVMQLVVHGCQALLSELSTCAVLYMIQIAFLMMDEADCNGGF